MQKKILSAVLSLFLVGSASSAFADYYPALDVDINDSFNKDIEINKSFDYEKNIEINKSVFDVHNEEGAVLNQYSQQGLGEAASRQRHGIQLPTQVMNGNVAAQANNVAGNIEGGVTAIGNYKSLSIDVAIDDSFNVDDSFNPALTSRFGGHHHQTD